jgi:hypothetical protein
VVDMGLNLIFGVFTELVNYIPSDYEILVNLALYSFFITIYAIFIWKYYRFLASRDTIELNLKRYNKSKHPRLEKFFAVLLFTLEYMVVLPFLVFFWFVIQSLFLLALSQHHDVNIILLISAAIIISIRISAYIGEDLSKDIAKILPFTILAAFLLGQEFFDLSVIYERVSQILLRFNNILLFLIAIFVVEFVLRGLYSLAQLVYSGPESSKD